jgi:hypothetical protein
MNKTAIAILQKLRDTYPGLTEFRRKVIDETAHDLGYEHDDYHETLLANELRICKGRYDYRVLFNNPKETVSGAVAATLPPTAPAAFAMSGHGVRSMVNTDSYIPEVDDTFVRWGFYDDIASIIRSKAWYPIFIAGLSGNGKSIMIEQACAALGREYIRIQFSAETDEDDLLGGFRLINGETVFVKGPVTKAMERGAIVLLDELDRSSSKIMCLQGVLEGKPILIKKTGETIIPQPGFNIIAAANTKGKGSEDGRFVTAGVMDEAFLERFVATFEQEYPPKAVEQKILHKHMEKFGKVDVDFNEKLVLWSEIIRQTFANGGVDEVISTRRLCHIVKTFSIFPDRLKSLKMCTSRFDTDTKLAFMDLYTKVDSTVSLTPATP